MRRLISIVVALACWPAAASAQLTATDEPRLVPPTSEAETSEELGWAVDISGSIVVAGVPGRDNTTAANDAGSAYAWVGTSRRQLLPTTRRADARFGEAVAVDGVTAAVGAPSESYGGTGTEEGAVYVFESEGIAWGAPQRITAGGDAAAGDNFGAAVVLEGDTLAIGAPGRATDQGVVYVYTRSGTTWSFSTLLTAPADDRAAQRGFGRALALSGDVLVVGGSNFFNGAPESVHVFERAGTTWSHATMLRATDGVVGNYYGSAVAIDGDRIAVGAPVSTTAGAVYLYERSAGAWAQTQKLMRAGSIRFGGAVAIDGDLLVVGAPGTASNAGRVYTFLRSAATGTWDLATESPAIAPSAGDYYGGAVAIDGRRAVIGATGEDVESTTSNWDDGAVYPVTYTLANGAECSDRSATLCSSTFCTDGVCCTTACAGGCDACSVAAGAATDGTCALTPGVECRAAADSCDIAETCGTTATCPDDVRMTECTPDAGPMTDDAGPAEDGGTIADAGSQDAALDASGDTIPRRTLSCTCRAGLGGGSGPGSIALCLAAIALAMARRRR